MRAPRPILSMSEDLKCCGRTDVLHRCCLGRLLVEGRLHSFSSSTCRPAFIAVIEALLSLLTPTRHCVMSSPAQLQLLDLPPELLLYISSHLDFSSLARLRRVSSAVHSLISSASELLFRRICFSCGITDEATAGSSTAAAAARGALNWGLTALSDQFDPEELRRAVEAQRAIGDVYDDVQTWEELGELLLATCVEA